MEDIQSGKIDYDSKVMDYMRNESNPLLSNRLGDESTKRKSIDPMLIEKLLKSNDIQASKNLVQ